MDTNKSLVIVECDGREQAESVRNEQWDKGREAYTLEEYHSPQLAAFRLMLVSAITLCVTSIILLLYRLIEWSVQ